MKIFRKEHSNYTLIILVVLLSALFPLIISSLKEIYYFLSTFFVIGYISESTTINYYEFSSLVVSTFTLIITSILTYLTYGINKNQFEMIKELHESKPTIKVYVGKVNFCDSYIDKQLIKSAFIDKEYEEINKVKNKKDLFNLDITTATKLQLEILLYNQTKCESGIIVENISISILSYDNTEILVENLQVKTFVKRQIHDGGRNYDIEDDFSYIYIEAQDVYKGIVEFESFDVQLINNEIYKAVLKIQTPYGDFFDTINFVYSGYLDNVNKYLQKINAAIEYTRAFKSNIHYNDMIIEPFGKRLNQLISGNTDENRKDKYFTMHLIDNTSHGKIIK